MTLKQYRRMCVFALRMVPVSIGGKRWQKVVREHVREILSRLSDPCFGCHWNHTLDWDNKTRLPDDDGTCGFAWSDGRMLLCDFMSDYLWDTGLEREKEDRQGNLAIVQTKVGCAVNCCIRAAIDVAVAPSGGVVGFTVGDLREMWAPRHMPEWVSDLFDPPIAKAVSSQTPVWL